MVLLSGTPHHTNGASFVVVVCGSVDNVVYTGGM